MVVASVYPLAEVVVHLEMLTEEVVLRGKQVERVGRPSWEEVEEDRYQQQAEERSERQRHPRPSDP